MSIPTFKSKAHAYEEIRKAYMKNDNTTVDIPNLKYVLQIDHYYESANLVFIMTTGSISKQSFINNELAIIVKSACQYIMADVDS